VGANRCIGVGTFLVEECNPSLVVVQEPDASSRDRLDLVIERTQIVVICWSRVGDVKIEHKHHAKIDTCSRYRIRTHRLTRKNPGLAVHGMSLLTTRIFQTRGRCAITEAVSAEVAHVASLVTIESSSDMVPTIGIPGAVAVALSNPAVGSSSVTCPTFI
jgi:hypothetical protein